MKKSRRAFSFTCEAFEGAILYHESLLFGNKSQESLSLCLEVWFLSGLMMITLSTTILYVGQKIQVFGSLSSLHT